MIVIIQRVSTIESIAEYSMDVSRETLFKGMKFCNCVR